MVFVKGLLVVSAIRPSMRSVRNVLGPRRASERCHLWCHLLSCESNLKSRAAGPKMFSYADICKLVDTSVTVPPPAMPRSPKLHNWVLQFHGLPVWIPAYLLSVKYQKVDKGRKYTLMNANPVCVDWMRVDERKCPLAQSTASQAR